MVVDSKQNFSEMLNKGVSLFKNKKYDLAKELYTELMKNFPNKAEIYYLAGLVEFELNNLEKACELMLKAIELNPFYECFRELAKIYLIQNKLDKSVENFERALAYNPDCQECRNILKKIAKDRASNKKLVIKGVYKKISDFKDCKITHIYDSKIKERKLPKAIEYFSDYELEKITPVIKKYLKQETEGAFVAGIPNGRVFVKQSEETYIITPDDKFIQELTLLPDKKPEEYYIMQQKELPEEVYIGDNVLVLTSLWGNNYYHWLSLIIPRIHALEKAGYKLEDFDKILINYVGFNYQKDIFKILGISFDKVVGTLAKGALLRAKNLVVPSIQSNLPTWATTCLRDKFKEQINVKTNKSDMIYISRNRATARRVLNEDKVFNFLSEFGFQMLRMEDYSFSEQLSIFANANIIVAPHGAGLTNISFCKPGTKLIEIFTPDWFADCFFRIGENVGIDHYYMFGNPQPNTNLDMTIDINRLALTMKFAGILS
ncbi:MAG: glycosyltransferase 61 family protein [Candidatus Gastranaerophilales bacterium]|nr:glycosyltransferase 61 family protein [Candidatus Gastranaerophilales bacterium]